MAVASVPRETSTTADWPKFTDVPVDLIDVDDNVRTDVGDVTELAESIKQHGLLQPISVALSEKPDRFSLVVGQRRLAAAKLAGLDRIPAIFDPKGGAGSATRGIRQIVENLQRQDLGPLEEARAFRGLLNLDPKLTQAELAKRIGRSAPYVSNALRILELDKKVLPLVESGQLTGAHAKALASLEAKEQRDLANWTVENKASAHDLETRTKWYREQANERAKEEKQALKSADAAETKLAELGATKDATTLISGGYYGGSVLKLLKKRGWPARDGYGYKRAKACDCEAFEVQQSWDGKFTGIRRTCINEQHAAAQREEEDAAWAAKQKRDAEKAAADAAELERRLAPITAHFAANASTPAVQRLTLFALVSQDYGTRARFIDRHGIEVGWDKPLDEVWAGIVKLPAAKLADEIARTVADHILHLSNAPAVLDAIAKVPELAEVMAKPAKAKKGGK